MMYMNLLIFMCLIIGLIAVTSNPSPYYAALGLAFSALCGCCLLGDFGASFLSLILLLIYLGGMLVVFAYSVALAAEPFPEVWGSWSSLYIFLYLVVIILCYLLINYNLELEYQFSDLDYELSFQFNPIIKDCFGVGNMYFKGVLFLMISGWALLLTLFVVLEVTRGLSRGSLRAV